ncbi:MAG: hypothetical protein QOJ69_816 [Actinomycetota bacterium]|jgi:hypothetical protein|nr:hypothetical protein [Actinomycetota bacterium]MEA2843145.1 hypothetical protein [Actinomycetota bacterium]
MGDGQERQGGTEGHLVAWAVGEARRLRLLGLRIPRALIDGTPALAGAGPAVAAADCALDEDVAEDPTAAG